MRAGGGRVVCKVGAEGVHSAAILDAGIGIAIKAEDGHPRAQYPAMLAVLEAHGAFPHGVPPTLQPYVRRAVRDTRDLPVGMIGVAALSMGDPVDDA
jgi:L-asparaginase II